VIRWFRENGAAIPAAAVVDGAAAAS
jgi:hypothetical protein